MYWKYRPKGPAIEKAVDSLNKLIARHLEASDRFKLLGQLFDGTTNLNFKEKTLGDDGYYRPVNGY